MNKKWTCPECGNRYNSNVTTVCQCELNPDGIFHREIKWFWNEISQRDGFIYSSWYHYREVQVNGVPHHWDFLPGDPPQECEPK